MLKSVAYTDAGAGGPARSLICTYFSLLLVSVGCLTDIQKDKALLKSTPALVLYPCYFACRIPCFEVNQNLKCIRCIDIFMWKKDYWRHFLSKSRTNLFVYRSFYFNQSIDKDDLSAKIYFRMDLGSMPNGNILFELVQLILYRSNLPIYELTGGHIDKSLTCTRWWGIWDRRSVVLGTILISNLLRIHSGSLDSSTVLPLCNGQFWDWGV